MKDLAPTITRQRLVIEGLCKNIITSDKIKEYLSELSVVTDMVQLTEPVTHRSEKYGEAAWIHWETSGAHFYAWDRPFIFFSVDIYTCKIFDVEKTVAFTKDFFTTTEIEFKEF